MDPSAQYQNQSQPYDPSSAAYYSYAQYNNYPYYPQDYSNYQLAPHAEDTSSSVHPPGVPVTSQSQYVGQDQYYAYQQQQQYDPATWQGVGVGTAPAHSGARAPVGHSYFGGGRRGGRGGGSSFRGRGRGRGRGGPTQAPPKQPAPPRQMAWCELCRVDCNSLEILEKHREGKKHKKNLKMQEELERLNKMIIDKQNAKPEEPETGETKVENEQEVSGSRGRGSKRKMRGGRGSNKWIRTSEGTKGSVEAPKPKPPLVPFVCELCHVTCETQVAFDSHLKGKKHTANLQHFQYQQTLLGQAALEALYPALQAILPTLQGNYVPNPDASSSSAPATESQDPQAALTQLLSSILVPNSDGSSSSAPQLQPGQDPQAVLAQLLATIIASGQAAATPGALATSSVGPPLVGEKPNPENLPIQSEAGSEEAEPAVVIEKKSDDLETLPEPAVVIDKKSDDLETLPEPTVVIEKKSDDLETLPEPAVVIEKKSDDLETKPEMEKSDAEQAEEP